MYSVLVYAITFIEKLDNTVFLLTDNLVIYNQNYELMYNNKIKNNMANKIFYNLKAFYLSHKYRNVKKVYGQDHVSGKNFFVTKYDFTLIEDGICNYTHLDKYPPKKTPLLLKIFGMKKTNILGLDEEVSDIILTGMMDIPEAIKHKTKIVSLKNKWNSFSRLEKLRVLSLFNLTLEDLYEFDNKIVVITQPFSEDNYITEREKIQIYERIVKKEKKEDVVIKTHPREVTNYQMHFPEYKLITKKFPMQLLALEDINIKKIITISSTSISEFINIKDIEIEVLGTNIHENIEKNQGYIAFDTHLRKFIYGREINGE